MSTVLANQQNPSLLETWARTAQQISTLRDFRQVQRLARGLGDHLESSRLERPSGIVHTATLSDYLRSEKRSEVLHGLSLLTEALDDPENDSLRQLEETLPGHLASEMSMQAVQLDALLTGRRSLLPSVGPASEAARNSLKASSYIGGRFRAIMGVLRDNTYEDDAIRAHRFLPERVNKRFYSHSAAERTLKSYEGFEAYEATQGSELNEIHLFVTTQLSFGRDSLRDFYQKTRDLIIGHAESVQKAWDETVEAINALNPPNFDEVSNAFWDRDCAIRQHPGLKELGVGPREFDLIRLHREWEANQEDTRLRFERYASSWDYILHQITERYKEAESSKVQKILKSLKKERFALEASYMRLARSEGTRKDRRLVADAESRYLGFLDIDLDAADYNDVRAHETIAQRTEAEYAERWRAINVATARSQYDYFKTRERHNFAIDELEQMWQSRRYQEFIGLVQASGRLSDTEIKELKDALKAYIEAGVDYLKVARAMMDESPDQREHQRNSKYRALFMVLWKILHDRVKKGLIKAEYPNADHLEPLTFVYKTQAQFIARGAVNMHGLAPLVEVTLGLKKELDREEEGAYLLPNLEKLAGRDWGVNILSHYVRRMDVVGASRLFGYFGQGIRPEGFQLEGGIETFPDGVEELEARDFSARSALFDATHVGQFEFAKAMGIAYLLGLGHMAILAQSGVRSFPIAGPFLGGLMVGGQHYIGSGAYIQRTKDPKKRKMENFILVAHLLMGNNLNIYGGGTRDIENPLPSPYANLRKHPEALHLPDYHPTRYSTGQPIKVAREAGVPIIPVAHDLGRIYPEPSMPMPPEMSPWEYLRPATLMKHLGGFFDEKTMFPHMRPGRDRASVAYGEPIFPGSLIQESDLKAMGYSDDLAAWASLPKEEREKKVNWLLLQLNFGLVRMGEMRAGYMATAHLYGRPNPPK